MPYRHFRRPGLYPALSYLSHHGVDVLCLQEQNSTRFGPLTYLLWRLALLLPFVYNSFAMEVLEYLAVGEGFLFPFFVADNKRHVIDYCQRHTRWKHHVTVPPPRYFFDSGLIILSAHPLDLTSLHQVHLKRDAGNRPGLLAVNFTVGGGGDGGGGGRAMRYRLYNVHFVPSLLDVNPVFRVLNLINHWLGRDTRALRQEHFAVLMDDIRQWQARDAELLVLVAGDFNISQGSVEEAAFTELVRTEVGLHPVTMKPLRATACERTFGHEGQTRQNTTAAQKEGEGEENNRGQVRVREERGKCLLMSALSLPLTLRLCVCWCMRGLFRSDRLHLCGQSCDGAMGGL